MLSESWSYIYVELFSLSSYKPLEHWYPDCMRHYSRVWTWAEGNKLFSSTHPPSQYLKLSSPALTSLHGPTSFFVPFASGSPVFILCVRFLQTALLNPSLKLIFVQWSNFFTHHTSIGYKRSQYFSKSCDTFLKPIFLSLSIQKFYSHGGHSCDWAVTNQMAVRVPWESETHMQHQEG